MDELVVNGDIGMTVKEISNAIGVAESTVRNKVSDLFPEIVKNGKTTYLNESQVLEIKRNIVPRDLTLKSKLENTTTDIEMKQKAVEVMQWLVSQVEIEKSARVEAERKNAILMHVSKTYTATEIAKECNMRSAQELNRFLVDKKIQYKQNDTWVLYSDYSGLGYTDIKQNVLDNGRIVYDRHFTQDGRAFILSLMNK